MPERTTTTRYSGVSGFVSHPAASGPGSGARSKLYDLIVKMNTDARAYAESSNGGECTDTFPLQKKEVRLRAYDEIYTQGSPDAKRQAFNRELKRLVHERLVEETEDAIRLVPTEYSHFS